MGNGNAILFIHLKLKKYNNNKGCCVFVVGFVDVSVSVATSFLNDPDPSSTSAVYHCGRYVGPAGDFMVSFSCMQDDPEGLSGYAIYARFNGELSRGNTICQMDIVLHDSI